MKVRPVFSRIKPPTHCPKCGFELEGWQYRSAIRIGDPNVVCPKCGTGLKFTNVVEFDRQPKADKIIFSFFYIFSALRYTVFAFGLALISELIFHLNIFFNKQGDQISPLLPVFLGIVTIVAIVVKSISLKKEVVQSKKRTKSFSLYDVVEKIYNEQKIELQNQTSTSDKSNYRK